MKKQGKRFLSDRGDEGGSVRWYVNSTSDYYRDVEAELYITDCFKPVTIEFSADKGKGLGKRIAKLDSLIEELQSFKEALVEANVKPKLYY